MYCDHINSLFIYFYFIFIVRLVSVLRGHSLFSSPPQRPMTSDLTWYHFYNVFRMTPSLTGIEPGTSRTRYRHCTTWLSRRRLLVIDIRILFYIKYPLICMWFINESLGWHWNIQITPQIQEKRIYELYHHKKGNTYFNAHVFKVTKLQIWIWMIEPETVSRRVLCV